MTDIAERLTYRAETLWTIVRPHAAILDLEAAAYIRQLEAELEVWKANAEANLSMVKELESEMRVRGERE